jgi:hypothetical protein
MQIAIRIGTCTCLLLSAAAGGGASPMMKHELRTSKALDGSPAIYYMRVPGLLTQEGQGGPFKANGLTVM